MPAVNRLRQARVEVWREMPSEVEKLAERRAIMQPAGPLLYAEAETRMQAELLYVVLDALAHDQFGEEAARPVLNRLLEHFASRLGGWYGLFQAAANLAAARQAVGGANPTEMQEVLRELALYMSRLNLWIDLLIPWNDINELMRANADHSDR